MEKAALIVIYLVANWLYLPLSRRPVKYYWKTKLDPDFRKLVPKAP